MQTIKVYVNKPDTAQIRCPDCGVAKDVSVKDIKDISRPVRVKCVCSSVFLVYFELRKQYRKPVELGGYYSTKKDDFRTDREMVVEDVSTSGVSFRPIGPHFLKPGDRIQLKFTLDNSKRSVIKCFAEVRGIRDESVGVELVGVEENVKKELGFYLLP